MEIKLDMRDLYKLTSDISCSIETYINDLSYGDLDKRMSYRVL